jgi:DNA polymerase-3 subunit delta'
MRLEGVVGQRHALRQLSAELNAGRLAHAYLFVGPKGVGRSTTAKALFAAMNCRESAAETPCGVCGHCHRLNKGTHEDFITLAPPTDAASAQIKVEEVREVMRTLSFAPFAGGKRMVLIKNAGHLNPTSSNALLKTLEEPPPNNVLVLTVQDPKDILPTLVSRCRRVNFTPLDTSLVVEQLINKGVDPQAASLKAAMGSGSLGRALELDQEQLRGELERLKVHLGKAGGPLIDAGLAEELVAEHRGPQRIDRQGLAESLDLWAQLYRDQAVIGRGQIRMRRFWSQARRALLKPGAGDHGLWV